MMIRRLAAVYLFLLALLVGGHYIAYPLYEPGPEATLDVWLIIDWFEAAGFAILLAATFLWKRTLSGESGWREYLEVNTMFYFTVVTALSFFPVWFTTAFSGLDDSNINWNVWAFVDAALPVLSVVVGLRLWRETARE